MNVNLSIIAGHLTRDPQLKYLPSQTPVVDFAIASTRKYKDGSGNQKEDTCFIDCRAFGKTAENINKHCKKGSGLYVEGRLTFEQWTGTDGSKHSKHRLTVESMQFVGKAPQGSGNASEEA